MYRNKDWFKILRLDIRTQLVIIKIIRIADWYLKFIYDSSNTIKFDSGTIEMKV